MADLTKENLWPITPAQAAKLDDIIASSAKEQKVLEERPLIPTWRGNPGGNRDDQIRQLQFMVASLVNQCNFYHKRMIAMHVLFNQGMSTVPNEGVVKEYVRSEMSDTHRSVTEGMVAAAALATYCADRLVEAGVRDLAPDRETLNKVCDEAVLAWRATWLPAENLPTGKEEPNDG